MRMRIPEAPRGAIFRLLKRRRRLEVFSAFKVSSEGPQSIEPSVTPGARKKLEKVPGIQPPTP